MAKTKKQTYEEISIPLGYTLQENTTIVDIFTAFDDILAGNKQFKYTCAELIPNENKVKLTGHYTVCPNCGKSTPAYRHYMWEKMPNKRFTHHDAQLWLTETMSLFESENKKIDLYTPISENDDFRCMHCGLEAPKSDKKVLVHILKAPHKITITYPLSNIGDIVRINWTPKTTTINEFPICETITFNMKRGKTHLTLQTKSGKIIAAQDISMCAAGYDLSSPLIDLIAQNVVIKNKLKTIFSAFWEDTFPFSEQALNVQKFALATVFTGYNADFYSYIPYSSIEKTLDSSYKSEIGRLHYANNAPHVYQASRLPNKKSIKRCMFNNPVLFLYIKELEALCEATRNDKTNFFNAFLESEHAYKILSFLHDCPGAFKLYKDICEADLCASFKEILFKHPMMVNEYALMYANLNEHRQKKTLEMLEKTKCKYIRQAPSVVDYFFITPSKKTIDTIEAQNINGYYFAPLKTRNDYLLAAKHLENCLGESVFDTPIVGVMQSGKYIAAIQVDVEYKVILQAFLKYNREIETNEHFFAAFEQWYKRNGYIYEGELPFD